MRAVTAYSSLALLAIFCTSCSHHKTSPPVQAQAPTLQTGKGTLNPQNDSQQQEKATPPLASPLPQPSSQSVPLPPPPPKKVHHRVKTVPKPADTAQAPAATASGTAAEPVASGGETSAQTTPAQQAAADHVGAASPIGQLTTGDSAMGEKTKHETADLINGTQQGLNGIKRPLSTDEKTTAAKIRTFLNQAQQALDNGDTDGALTLATKAKLLLDELTKP
jgi:outer membrane biosynthesis protein TonB